MSSARPLITLAWASLGLVAALAWNEAIKATIKQAFGTAETLAGLYSYALIATTLSIVVLSILARIASGMGGDSVITVKPFNRTACALLVVAWAAVATAAPSRDLSIDESRGGHTLSRHVGRSDRDLADRLAREHVSAASTWPDRATAERVVGAAIAASQGKIARWADRSGRRPNLVLDYRDPEGRTIGRALTRDGGAPLPCTRALVVLKWDERARGYFVLTAYPEPDR